MRIGMIGAGRIGATLSRLLVEAGHEVVIANTRGPESLGQVIAEMGPGASAATVAEAARQGDIVVEAIPFGKVHTLPGAELAGKVLISVSNYYPGRDGDIDLGGLTQGEYVHSLFPKTHLAKAFNTIYFEHLRTEGDKGAPLSRRRVLPFVASDTQAKTTTEQLIEALGFGPLFLGRLAAARGVSEPDGLLYNRQLSVRQAQELLKQERPQ